MPRFISTSRITVLATLLLAAGTAVATPQAKQTVEDAAKREKAAHELALAIEGCDKGAAVPLDFSAKAPPVQYPELFPVDFEKTKLKALQAMCQAAWVGAPNEKRMHLQWIRTTMMIGESNLQLLTPQVRRIADEGSAEAKYLLYQLHRINPDAPASSMLEVSRDEAWTALNAAAEQGHMEAIQELMAIYRGSRMAKRDLKQVVKWARRLEGAPPQGNEITAFELEMRARAPKVIAWTTLEEEGFSATENRMAFRFSEAYMKSGNPDADWSARVVVEALRAGRGTKRNPGRAREILEKGVKTDKLMVPLLADMLVKGEGGPKDGKRALDMLRSPEMQQIGDAASVLADILLAGQVAGYRPQEAILALTKSQKDRDYVRLAGLVLDYAPQLDNPERLISGLQTLAQAGNADAAIALAKLKLSRNAQFTDEMGVRALLEPFAHGGNREALWLYATAHYANLGSSSYQPTRLEGGLSDAELMALIDEGVMKEEPQAFLLKAKLLRAGVIYPQDDRAATDMLVQAAKRDNIEALLLLGTAYDEGLGIQKNKRKRVEAWRRAARLGSLEAKSKLAQAFTFDTFDKLLTLEEGVTWRIALYNNGYGRRFDATGLGSTSNAEMEFMGLFMGRAMEAGPYAVGEAVMNAFRDAPAGLEDKNLVALGKAFPPEIKVAIEKRLAREGFLKGQPEGYWGPDVRRALTAWVEAQTPAVKEASAQATSVEEQTAEGTAELISKETVGRMWDAIRAEFGRSKNDRQRRAALAKVNTLAQYGNIDARWALLPNYHKHANVRRVVSAAEITRYGLDLMVEKPPSAEKVEFEFIFNTTQIYQDGKAREFGQAVIAAIRDDKRLQDPLVFGGILQQFAFAPGACDAVLDAGKRAGVDNLGAEGCDNDTLSALVTFAKAKGPAGIDARNRKAAAESIRAMDLEASR